MVGTGFNAVVLEWTSKGENVQVILPKWKNLFEGYVLEIGDKWIDVQNTKEGTWRFYLPGLEVIRAQVEGMMKILEPLREHEPTSPIILNGNTNCDQEL